MLERFEVKTHKKIELIDITRRIKEVIGKSGVREGICTVFVPHTTAGITINENADANVVRDIIYLVNKIIPFQENYKHIEGNSPGHIKSSLFSASLTILVENGAPLLGTWQGIYFCEFDGPRTRKLFVKTIEG